MNVPTGATGADGESIGTVAGVVESENDLPPVVGAPGELMIVSDYQGLGEPHLFVWNDDAQAWQHVGELEGVIGPTGATGPVGTILGSFETPAELPQTGNQGDAYLVGGSLYVWDGTSWDEVGNLQGPTGTFDPGDPLFSVAAPDDDSAEVGYGETLKFTSSTLDIEVSENPAVVSINSPSSRGLTVQFGSVTTAHVQSLGGARSTIVAVGIGHDQFVSTSEPIVVKQSAISNKMINGGTVTEVYYSLSVSATVSDVPPVNMHARLYKAASLTSKEFHYVPGSEVEFTVPYNSQIGDLFTRNATLTHVVEPGSQLVLVFYCTTSGVNTSGLYGTMSGAVLIK